MSAEVLPLNKPAGPPAWQSLYKSITWLGDRISGLFELQKLYGDVVLSQVGTTRVYFLFDPDAVQECLVTRHKDFHKSRAYFALRLVMGNGLVTSEGDFHLRQRRMMQPAFHRDRIRGYGDAMVEFSAQTRDAITPGAQLDINREMMRMTLYIVSKALFGSDVRGDAGRVGVALDTLMHMDAVFLNPLGPFIAKLPLPINRTRVKMTQELDSVIYRMIAERRASGDTGDLLSMLLAARDEDDGTGMTDQQVRDEAVTLFLAGHETTANALSWTWYLLSQNPEVEARFHAELDEVLGSRTPTPDDYPSLPYTRQVLAESMRIYPPVWVAAREAIRDTQIAGYHVPKGSQLLVGTIVTHRDPKLYPDPMRFDPDRFSEAASAGRHKFAYYPFGGGRRLCIGEGFAWMEGVLALATIGQKWKFRMVPGHKVELDPHITLRPRGGLPMIAEAR
jgi:cytochrome P450